jgi:hypothetical protein
VADDDSQKQARRRFRGGKIKLPFSALFFPLIKNFVRYG